MSECKFKFPLLNGGCASGLNDAGIQFFKTDPIAALARECAQNSLDARASDGHPAKLVFKLHELTLQDIPGSSDLNRAFQQCRTFWPSGSPEFKFCNTALSLAGKGTIPILEISDFNTTGLEGGDKDIGTSWHSLVMSAGFCNKGAENAGGFGIGKFAPFAVSRWRAVFYSSLTPAGEYAFRGVCNNMTHCDDSGRETQNVGYYGYVDDNNHKIDSIRNSGEIPDFFRRKETGTSIYVLAFSDDCGWQDRLKHAVLENFWPAIYFEKICFEVDGEKIDKGNLAEYMAHYKDLKLFMQCLESQDHLYFKENVGRLGECELYFLLTQEKTQDVVCTRASRMKIQSLDTYWKLNGISFVGLFSCLSKEGNIILKNMEPPEHTTWDYRRSNDEDAQLSENDRKNTITDLKKWIRGKISEHVKRNYTGETELEDVGRYFNVQGSNPDGEDDHDGFSSHKTVRPQIWTPKRGPTSSDTTGGAGGETDKDGVTPPERNSNGGGGRGVIRHGRQGGSSGRQQVGNAPKIKFAARGYVCGDEYILVLTPKRAFTGELELLASGEDASEKLEIINARTDTETLAVRDGKISKISLSSGASSKIYVKTRGKEYFSVEVVGHESN